MKKILWMSVMVILMMVGVIVYWLTGNSKPEEVVKQELTINSIVTNKEDKIEIYIEIKNNNLTPYVKSDKKKCEPIWTVDVVKKEEKTTTKEGFVCEGEVEEFYLDKNESLKYITEKEIKEPGEYVAIINVFEQEFKKEFTIEKNEE